MQKNVWAVSSKGKISVFSPDGKLQQQKDTAALRPKQASFVRTDPWQILSVGLHTWILNDFGLVYVFETQVRQRAFCWSCPFCMSLLLTLIP